MKCSCKYIYSTKNLQKKLSQLSDLHLELKDLYEFEQGGVKPLRSCRTRWIAHKTNAMRLLIDKFGLYMQHLEEIAADKSCKSDQRAKLKGYLTQWRKTSMLLNLGFYFELLQPASCLSLALQEEELDPVRAIDALKAKSINDFSHLAGIKKKIKDKRRWPLRLPRSCVEADSCGVGQVECQKGQRSNCNRWYHFSKT